MKNNIKIGIIIADEMEYVPMRAYSEKNNGKRLDFYSREGHNFLVIQKDRTIEIQSVLCGIGMVNAAAAAVFIAQTGADYIINTGLSGGISGISRGEMTIGTEYIEHDFDLRPLGRKLGEKPLQEYIYKADELLLQVFTERFDFIKPGVMVSGDSFVSGENHRNHLKTAWNAMSCDMESAAVAYVCNLCGVKYAAVRRVSDDAGNDAPDSYNQMNDKAESALLDIVFEGIYCIFDNNKFWI